MSHPILIKDFVSTMHSPRHILSQESWSRGMSNFFIEDIPFSYSTGSEFAERLVHLIDAFVQDAQLTAINVYELGAGLGYLSRRMLDVIDHNFLHLTSTYTWHVSEYHETMIEQMKKYKVFSPYNERVRFKVMDCVDPPFEEPPHVSILSYVFDSLPTRSIEFENGQAYEVLVKTTINRDATLIDTSNCPPQILDPEDIKTLLEGPLSNRKQSLLGRLSECLNEEYTRISISQSTMSEEERFFLEGFLADLAPHAPIRFNFSYDMVQSLQNTFKQCPEKAMLLAYDFGFTINNPHFSWNHMTGRFGACQFYSIFVPIMSYIATRFKLDVTITDYEQGHSQMMCFSKGVSASHIQGNFHRHFNKEGHSDAQLLSNELSALPEEKERFLSELFTRISRLNRYEKENYSLLMNIAKACQRREALEEAKDYAQRAINQYGAFAITAKHLLADIHHQQGDFNAAKTVINEGLDCAHDYYGFHHLNAIIAGKEEQSDTFIKSAHYCLAFAPTDATIIWDHLITLALIYVKKNHIQKAKDIFLWIANTSLSHPNRIPAPIAHRAASITERFERLFI